MGKSKKYKPTGKTYEIKTIAELSLIVTKENLSLIMHDLELSLTALLSMEDICQAVNKDMGIPHERLKMDAFNWLDDGKNDLMEIVMTEPETGMKLVIDKNGVDIHDPSNPPNLNRKK